MATGLAACGGNPVNPPPPPAAAITSVSVTPPTVTAGQTSTGTVSLSAGAPSGGANISLSSDSDRAVVPASVAIATGASSGTFNISTAESASTGNARITATYLNLSVGANLTVNAAAPAVRADFAVNPKAGTPVNPGQCAVYSVTKNGTLLNELRCEFNASGSTPASGISQYRWTFPSGANSTVVFTATTPILDLPTVGCATFAAVSEREVTLTITAPTGTDTSRKTINFVKVTAC